MKRKKRAEVEEQFAACAFCGAELGPRPYTGAVTGKHYCCEDCARENCDHADDQFS